MAVDVGAFGAQMVPEMALGAVTGGVGGLAAMGARAFGGGAHENGIQVGSSAYRLHMDHLMLLMNRNKGKGMDDWK